MNYVSNPSRLRKYLRDPRAFYYYANKMIRLPRLRKVCWQAVKLAVPANQAIAPAAELAQLQEKGVFFWDQLLDTAAVADVKAYFEGKPVYDQRDLHKTPLDFAAAIQTTRQIKLRYFEQDVAACPALLAIANDPRILALVGEYFQCKPTLSIMEAWWTRAGKNSGETLYQDDMYHRDVEDFKFIKLFVYLTDVAEENGAHCFITESHCSSALVRRGAISDVEAAAAFPATARRVLTGRAGCGFLEDTWGLHRSLPAQKGARLIFSITYSITRLNPQSPSAPIAPLPPGLDAYVNRVYFR